MCLSSLPIEFSRIRHCTMKCLVLFKKRINDVPAVSEVFPMRKNKIDLYSLPVHLNPAEFFRNWNGLWRCGWVDSSACRTDDSAVENVRRVPYRYSGARYIIKPGITWGAKRRIPCGEREKKKGISGNKSEV